MANDRTTAIIALPKQPANDVLPFKSMFEVPPEIRRIVRGAFDDGLDLEEIARIFNMPRHWVAAFVAEKA